MGLDRQGLEECLTSNRHLEKIRSDTAEGDRLGIEGTPSYWVNGRKLLIVTPSTLRRVFEEILKTPR
jgi:predicted DsbA family dithiol-disulfide isomerase